MLKNIRIKTDKYKYKLLILLLLTDLFFIVLHISFGQSSLFSIERDMGFAETFQYIKEYWIVLMLLWIALKRRSVLFFVWSILFFFLLFDDALRFHESAGTLFAKYYNLKGNWAQDIGQLAVSIVIGVIFFSIIGISHYLSKQKFRKISKHLAILILTLAFFGVFMDAVHSLFKYRDVVNNLLLLIEDGGEMVVMSLITWYVFNIDQSSLVQNELKRNA